MQRIFYTFFIAAMIAFVSCSNAQSNYVLHPKEFSAKLQQSNTASLIDVRTPEEYADGHLPNAINIDWSNDMFSKQVATLDKSKPVFVYCHSGRRSSAAAKAMRKAGFIEVYELQDGIVGWEEDKLPTTK